MENTFVKKKMNVFQTKLTQTGKINRQIGSFLTFFAPEITLNPDHAPAPPCSSLLFSAAKRLKSAV